MAEEFMDCNRKCGCNGWDDHITISMCNMGQYGEETYSQHLTIEDRRYKILD